MAIIPQFGMIDNILWNKKVPLCLETIWPINQIGWKNPIYLLIGNCIQLYEHKKLSSFWALLYFKWVSHNIYQLFKYLTKILFIQSGIFVPCICHRWQSSDQRIKSTYTISLEKKDLLFWFLRELSFHSKCIFLKEKKF